MNKRLLGKNVSIIIMIVSNIFAINDLSVREDVSHPRVGPGYIDEAVLVVEPYGAYTEQSLYIKYSDHAQFQGQKTLVTHSFNLPEGAVVNDLWLWIGDSIMQARVFERKHAQGIWDTLTNFKIDPAYLRVDKNQYILSVYPLTSGSFRKIKMKYIVPSKFIQKVPVIDLSYQFFSADHNLKTPVRILFRSKDDNLGIPKIVEMPNLEASATIDTFGNTYKVLNVPDIKSLGSFTLTYTLNLSSGAIASTGRADTNIYFTFGMYEQDYFRIFNNQSHKKSFIGLDISGMYGIKPDVFVNDVQSFLLKYLTISDTMKLLLAGEGMIDSFPSKGWSIVNENSLLQLASDIKNSRVITAKKQTIKPRILFSDGGDGGEWRFDGIEELATVDVKTDLMEALPVMDKYDIVASYWHGLSRELTNSELDSLKKALDAFFERGGFFLTLYCYNRDRNHIAKRYFNGLIKPTGWVSAWLHGNPTSSIGYGFPDNFYYTAGAPLMNSDNAAENELLDNKGQPYVISKKIGKGRFILTGLWHKQDDKALKRSLCTVLLNLQNQSKYWQLRDILTNMVSTYEKEKFSEALLMSNSDYMITDKNIAPRLAPLTVQSICTVAPIKTINLLDGQAYFPPIFHSNNNDYYGSSYCLSYISEKTKGMYTSKHIDNWEYISKLYSQKIPLQHESFVMNVSSDGKPVSYEVFKILPNLAVDRAYFFAGKTPLADSITLSFAVKYKNFDSVFTKSSTFSSATLKNTRDSALYTMYENEILKKMFLQTPLDTKAIVKFALSHRILNDFTAFLALEPNDTIHFMTDPPDESKINSTGSILNPIKQSFKNLNIKVLTENGVFKLRIISAGKGNCIIKIFNVMGKLVAEKAIKFNGSEMKTLSFQEFKLGKATYIAVAKFFPSADSKSLNIESQICKFTVMR